MGHKLIDMTGRKIWRWTVMSRAENRGPKGHIQTYWRCRCECGTVAEVLGKDLRAGKARSCGCSANDGRRQYGLQRARNNKHPFYVDPEWDGD